MSDFTNSKTNSTLSEKTIANRVDSILKKMTLEEKIGQMLQFSDDKDLTGTTSKANEKLKKKLIKKGLVGSLLNVTSVKEIKKAQQQILENSRLKIPLLFGFDVIHGYKTMFPIPLAEASSWDLDLMERTAQVSAKEATASGLNWTFAPMVDISRDARWGRIMESAGEDPFLNTQVGLAKLRGYQGKDLSQIDTMAACAKHFAGYGFVEGGREYNTVNIGKNELHNTVLPPFKALVNAGIATVMNAFNDIDGIPATASHELQTAILKENWNFEGVVVSDWSSIEELVMHGVAENLNDAAKIAVNAGNDMDMEGYAYAKHLTDLVDEKIVNEDKIDESVRRILTLKFKLGLFENPFKYCDEERERKEVYTKSHLQLAHESALKSIVLLKNENHTLPLNSKIESIALIGPLAKDKNTPLGNWRACATPHSAVSVFEGLQNKLPSNIKLTCHVGVDYIEGEQSFLTPLQINTTNHSKIKEALEIAKSHDQVILVVGENAFQTGEGRSQANIGFSGLQLELIKSIYDVNPNIVLVLMNGRPMDINWPAKHIPAILETWHLGSQAGNAIADVLLGNYNPSGKLTVSFPRDSGSEPNYYNHKPSGRPTAKIGQVVYNHYNDIKDGPLYPFGFGLSYTTFKYGKVKLSSEKMTANETISLSIEVTNTGKQTGEEIVQLYIRDLVASISRPVLELKSFKKIKLKPNEHHVVTFEISQEQLAFYTIRNKWEVEPGEFEISVGSSSKKLQRKIIKYYL
jgi:beta-glucosidase